MSSHEFTAGVVEGFYGRPWSHEQRLRLLHELGELGLNTYLYAPKDDLKHRAVWRETYDDTELARFRELVHVAGQNGVRFQYGLSPGLDGRFDEPADRQRIRDRFAQLHEIGVRHFALLFDDLPEAAGAAGEPLATAHCRVANETFEWLMAVGCGESFLYCPTPYCDAMDRLHWGGAGYLDELGHSLNPRIDVLWTGPEIASPEIPVASIDRVAQRLGRPPLIWDNLFANDYDLRRLHCGPYAGRDPELRSAVRGILINPNNEYSINFVPLRTFARYVAGGESWISRDEYFRAVAEWLPRFTTVRTPLRFEDLVLLADCFYLPGCDGAECENLIAATRLSFADEYPTRLAAYQEFHALNLRIQATFDRLTELCDRELFHAWSRHAWQLKEELATLDTLLARQIQHGHTTELPSAVGDGLLARLEQVRAKTAQSPADSRLT